MPENFYYGGGAAQSTIHPIIVAATLLAAAVLFVGPRKYIFGSVITVVLLAPFGSQFFVGGFHFYLIRVFVGVFGLRFLRTKLTRKEPLLANGLTSTDRLFCFWAVVRVTAYLLLHRDFQAFTNQLGFCLDLFGAYFLFRFLFRSEADVVRGVKSMVFVVTVLALCMGYEYRTGFNVSNWFGFAVVPWIRDSSIRAQGTFAHSITAGCLGATTAPLFFWLWKVGRARTLGGLGIAAATVATFTSTSSTPVTAYIAGLVALALWPIRRHMRVLRWGIVLVIVSLALVMKAPIWYIVARVDLVGGHGWDRAFLLDQFANHFTSWWLIGTDDNGSWGEGAWDRCNQFVVEAATGGLATLVLFIAMLSVAFSVLGQLIRKRPQFGYSAAWLSWCVGSALLAHVTSFYGVSYWDQSQTWWVAFLAMIPAIAVSRLKAGTDPPQTVDRAEWQSPNNQEQSGKCFPALA